MRSFYTRLLAFVSSRTFFAIMVGLFVVHAFWFAYSARYPMAFDEEYHLGLIKLHALQWNPIFTHQPAGLAQYGALTTDPSYLFHWLMSLPYRVMKAAQFDQMQIIVVLRYLNIILFTGSIVLLRWVLKKTTASLAAIHVGLGFFLFIPVVPFLAATINYDNLQNLLLMAGLLALLRFRERLEKNRYDISAFVMFMACGLLGSMVKFTFLPFLTAFAAYWLYATVRFWWTRKKKFRKDIKKAITTLSSTQKILIIGLFVFSCWIFLNTYAVNIVKYHNPVPQCGQVVDYQRCQAYAPWYRNYLSAINNPPVNPNPVTYSAGWVGGMFNRLFFTINGKTNADRYQNYMAPMSALAGALLALGGLALSIVYGWRILRRDAVLTILLFVSAVYTASVWGRNYHDYLHLKQAVAINGRYLIPILPFVIIFFIAAYQRALARKTALKLLILSCAVFLYAQGAGASSFVYYSRDTWYWEQHPNVRRINHGAKKVISPFFITTYIKALDHLYQ